MRGAASPAPCKEAIEKIKLTPLTKKKFARYRKSWYPCLIISAPAATHEDNGTSALLLSLRVLELALIPHVILGMTCVS